MDYKKVRDDLIHYEYFALAWLLRHLSTRWYGAVSNESRDSKEHDRIRGLRDAVGTAIGRGGREDVPHELLRNEYLVMQDVAKWLAQWSKENEVTAATLIDLVVPVTMDATPGPIELKRPLPVPKNKLTELERLLVEKKTPERIAQGMTAWRFGVGWSTVQSAPSEKSFDRMHDTEDRPYRVAPPNQLQLFLQSVFLDLCSCQASPSSPTLRACVLDALLRSDMHPFLVYYLVQVANDIPAECSVALCRASDIRKVCDLLPEIRPDYVRFTLREFVPY